MNKVLKYLMRFVLEVALATFLVMGVKALTGGMWLWGLPDLKEVRSVSISCPSVTDAVREISDKEDLELARKLTGFLKYDLFEQADTTEEPLISITYHLRDGTDQTVSANNNTVWWNGKSYSLKDKETFINLAEGIFFLEDLQAMEG